MMECMRDLLPDTIVIHAGHRAGLERFHDREIQLGSGPIKILAGWVIG